MTVVVLAAEAAAARAIEWWVFVPVAVMAAFVLATAPVWPYSRGWGWAPAGMSAMGLFAAALFTLAWILS